MMEMVAEIVSGFGPEKLYTLFRVLIAGAPLNFSCIRLMSNRI
jgi:hypothetical protein